MTVTFSAATVAPLIADILAMIRFISPLREVLVVRKEKRIGELNAFPFAAAILNTIGWVVYACLKPNFYIFAGDAPGLICSLWMLLSLYPHTTEKMQNVLNTFVTSAAALWILLTLVTIILQDSPRQGAIVPMWGWAVAVTQVFLMASPLSTMWKAIKERNSASFHALYCIMGLVSSTMWVVYSMVIKDYFVMVPNLIGGVLSATSVLVCFVLPRTAPRTPAEQEQARIRAIEANLELVR